MPRWPAGLHVASGSLRAVGGRDRRIPSPDVAGFWHQQVGDLFAAAGPVRVNGGGQAAALAGPQGLGEKWDVQLVQVSTSSGLAVQTTAQVWRAVSGITQNLLGQTVNGGIDDLGIICPTLSAGEQLAVIWTGASPGDTAQATIRGIRYVLTDG